MYLFMTMGALTLNSGGLGISTSAGISSLSINYGTTTRKFSNHDIFYASSIPVLQTVFENILLAKAPSLGTSQPFESEN